MFPRKYGIIIVIPNYILEWYQDEHDIMCEGDAQMELISKYGGVPEPEKCSWEIKEEFKADCLMVRLTNTEEQEGLYATSSFCPFPHRNLDVQTIYEDFSSDFA